MIKVGPHQVITPTGPDGPSTSILSTGLCPSRQGPAPDTSDASASPALTALPIDRRDRSPHSGRHALTRGVDVDVDVHTAAASRGQMSDSLGGAGPVRLDEGEQGDLGHEASPAEPDDGELAPGDELVGEGA